MQGNKLKDIKSIFENKTFMLYVFANVTLKIVHFSPYHLSLCLNIDAVLKSFKIQVVLKVGNLF